MNMNQLKIMNSTEILTVPSNLPNYCHQQARGSRILTPESGVQTKAIP